MTRARCSSLAFLVATLVAQTASAVSSAELYTVQSYRYGRFDARIRYAPGEGVISSFFLWKEGSEVTGTFWNELDFEKLGADCRMQTNALYGTPVKSTEQVHRMPADLCEAYHDYRFEWTPTYIAWFIDETEIRRETGPVVTAFAENAPAGMQIHFNVWPGNENFGGKFDPAILPVREYISWVAYSSYADGGFKPEWRAEFEGSTIPNDWATGTWASPYELSTHEPQNVSFVDGIAVLSLTSDQALGFTGSPPADGKAGAPSVGGTSSTGGGGSSSGPAGAAGSAPAAGMSAGTSNPGAPAAGGGGGAPASGGSGAPASASGGSGTAASGGSDVAAPSGAANNGGAPGAPSYGVAGTNTAGAATVSAGSDGNGCACGVTGSRRRDLSFVSAALLALAVLRRRRGLGAA